MPSIESVIQSQKHQMDELHDTIDRLNKILEDQSEVSQLKKVIRKKDEQNQKLEAKCAKIL